MVLKDCIRTRAADTNISLLLYLAWLWFAPEMPYRVATIMLLEPSPTGT